MVDTHGCVSLSCNSSSSWSKFMVFIVKLLRWYGLLVVMKWSGTKYVHSLIRSSVPMHMNEAKLKRLNRRTVVIYLKATFLFFVIQLLAFLRVSGWEKDSVCRFVSSGCIMDFEIEWKYNVHDYTRVSEHLTLPNTLIVHLLICVQSLKLRLLRR